MALPSLRSVPAARTAAGVGISTSPSSLRTQPMPFMLTMRFMNWSRMASSAEAVFSTPTSGMMLSASRHFFSRLTSAVRTWRAMLLLPA